MIKSPYGPSVSAEEYFDLQVNRLRDKGLTFSRADADRLRSRIATELQPFIVVPSRPNTIDLSDFMALVEFNGKRGRNYLEPQSLTDVVEVPQRAHVLLDVEDGRQRLDMSPSVSYENIRCEGRLVYPLWYGLVHAIVFPCVLQDHYLDLVGSRYYSERVPFLYLNEDGPGLGSGFYDTTNPEWGAPSAGSVLGS